MRWILPRYGSRDRELGLPEPELTVTELQIRGDDDLGVRREGPAGAHLLRRQLAGDPHLPGLSLVSLRA